MPNQIIHPGLRRLVTAGGKPSPSVDRQSEAKCAKCEKNLERGNICNACAERIKP